MKNLSKWSSALVLGSTLLASGAHAFDLKHVQTKDVADANMCGDLNRLARYELVLSQREALPELEWQLISRRNLVTLEKELRSRFYVPKSARGMILTRMGTEAGQAFIGTDHSTLDWCYGMDFAELFGFTIRDGRFAPRTPGAVTFLQLAFEMSYGETAPITVVIDRVNSRLYIHQEE